MSKSHWPLPELGRRTLLPSRLVYPWLRTETKVYVMGSCFAQQIQQRLEPLGIATHGPLGGTLYQLPGMVRWLAPQDWQMDELHIVERDGRFFCLEAHSSLWAESPEKLLAVMNAQRHQWREEMVDGPLLVWTLGSSIQSYFAEDDKPISNQQKLSAAAFYQQLLTPERQLADLCQAWEWIIAHRPQAKLVITVSPVRHGKDDLVRNMRSKAHLLTAVHDFAEKYPTQVSYFPAFEWMMDDLRDYRYYGSDLLHPTAEAVDYIFSHFLIRYADEHTLAQLAQNAAQHKHLQHRPMP